MFLKTLTTQRFVMLLAGALLTIPREDLRKLRDADHEDQRVLYAHIVAEKAVQCVADRLAARETRCPASYNHSVSLRAASFRQ